MIINDFTFRGDLESEEVLTALCAGFDETPPKCSLLLKQIKQKKGIYEHSGLGPLSIFGIVLVVLIIFICVLGVYRKFVKREIKDEMRT